MSDVAIICHGPCGIGYFCEVAELPTQDAGVVADRHGALLVCDAAIVAYLSSLRFPGQVHLVTNNLGSVEGESELLRTKLGLGVTIYPDPTPYRGAPIDMIFIDRRRGTRSFVTTNYYPSGEHILTATRDLYVSLPADRRVVHYVDIEVGSDSGKAALETVPLLARNSGSLWNLGQVTRLSEAEDWLQGIALPERAIVQISLGNSTVDALELRSTYQRITSRPNQSLVVTFGMSGAAFVNATTAEVVGVEAVSDAFTLGAGAVLAGFLVMALARDDMPDVRTTISHAVAAATRYVRDATTVGDLNGLALW
ncbi:MAG: hypothetical protein ABI140_13030 [Jatrophihabitantaceae bacterium]